jgi:hypothetical protein
MTFRFPQRGMQSNAVDAVDADGTFRILDLHVRDILDEDPPPADPDPGEDPSTYPGSDSDLPTYDDIPPEDPPDQGKPNDPEDPGDDPPTGEGSDCDGTIGIVA